MIRAFKLKFKGKKAYGANHNKWCRQVLDHFRKTETTWHKIRQQSLRKDRKYGHSFIQSPWGCTNPGNQIGHVTNFVQQSLLPVGPKQGKCITSLFCHPRFGGGSWTFIKFVDPCIDLYATDMMPDVLAELIVITFQSCCYKLTK